jgi:nucleotide-binding universal stress UspA family protein
MPADIPDVVMELARLYDCSILPASEEINGLQVPLIEEVLFGSGRPLILVPGEQSSHESLGVIVIAWDGSRPATRAVHDAIPLLRQASSVEVVSITEEKPLDKLPSGHDLVRHLKAHEIAARYEEVRFDVGSIGDQIMQEARRLSAGLLVMGAYGHSRIRQIVFGGATRTVLKSPALPVFLSY